MPEEEEDEEEIEAKFSPIPDNIPSVLKPIETQALRYVSGYLFKKIGKQPCKCKNFFLKHSEESDDSELFLSKKEYTSGVKRLKYVNSNFLEKLKQALHVIKFIFNRDLHKKKSICVNIENTYKKVFTH